MMMNKFVAKVKKNIEENNLLIRGQNVLMGVSGGADSLALLFSLYALKDEYDLKLFTVTINHGIRNEAESELEYVKQICAQKGITFFARNINVLDEAKKMSLGTEETGRRLRYKIFDEILEEIGGGSIALAHNMNDVAETMLFNLSRGTGVKGLCSIPEKRGNIIRPLLCMERKEIEEYLADIDVEFCTDKSNFTDEYTRNRIRNNILPLFEKNVSNNTVNHMAETASQLKEIMSFLDKACDEAYKKVLIKREADKLTYKKKEFLDNDVAIQKALVKRAIDELVPGNRDIMHRHIEAVLNISDKNGTKSVNIPYGITVEASYETLSFYIGEPVLKSEDIRYEAKIIDNYEGFDYGQKQYTKCFDYDKIDESLVFRKRESKDVIAVTSAGGKKKLKDYMIDEKIPAKERDNIFVLADGKNILWVVGYRISEAYKVTSNTKKILMITIFKEE